jgi:DinB superfamily
VEKKPVSKRSEALAQRIEQGARDLAKFAEGLSDADWQKPVPQDGRTVGVIVHHVGNMYPIEVQLAQVLASGKAVEGVSWDDVAKLNHGHSHDKANVSKTEALDFLRKNSQAAADAVRTLTDEQLDSAAGVSLNAGAPLTCQFFIEDHALRHSFHHLAKIKAALGK